MLCIMTVYLGRVSTIGCTFYFITQDAIRSFCNILLYIQRAKPMIQNRAYQIDAVSTINIKRTLQ